MSSYALDRFGLTFLRNHPAVASDPRPLHASVIKSHRSSIFVDLLCLYSASFFKSYTSRLFLLLPSPCAVAWTTLISATAGSLISITHFASMHCLSVFPTQRTLGAILKTCASLPALRFGIQIHSLSIKLSFSSLPFSGSALLNFYSKCRLPDHARQVFDEITEPDDVCYSALIGCLSQNSRFLDSLAIFVHMRRAGIGTTASSRILPCILHSVAEFAAFDQCNALHAYALVSGVIHTGVFVVTAVIDSYGKSGMVEDARKVFDEYLSRLNSAGWAAMMSGYAQQGAASEVLKLFYSMQQSNLEPDDYTFTSVLSAFSNAAMATEAEEWIRRMKTRFGLDPKLQHYTCLVYALGRSGRLSDAENVILTMPVTPDAAIWRALLSCCVFHNEPNMAWRVAKRIDEEDDAVYSLVAAAFAAARKWEEAYEMRNVMRRRGVKKEVGQSWIESKGMVHVFAAGEDYNNPDGGLIWAKLNELMGEIEKLGYVPIVEEELHEVGDEEKKKILRGHSEKLALAFGVMSGAAPRGKALRIVKNLRMCRDCHEAFKYMGRVVEKEIIVRDNNRYHRFVDGVCSCGDIW